VRKKIYQMVHVYDGGVLSVLYKYFMSAAIVVSLLPLMTKQTVPLFRITDGICLGLFVADFLLRWLTADLRLEGMGAKAFLKFPFRFISVIDLLSILALMTSVQVLAVFRVARIFRYSKSVSTIVSILQRSKKPLIAVGSLAVGYILVSAIIMFNVEPASFPTFFDAVYWSTVSLTTVGYGDLYPVTVLGRVVAMISSFFGIAIVALPAGVVTAEYMNALRNQTEE
jgi:voltage-gated potassium channel